MNKSLVYGTPENKKKTIERIFGLFTAQFTN